MRELLVLLGKRVHELRAAKKWSQEEFAHISGFHRTYIGQIERGEKNISFANLAKVAGVLGMTMSELLSGLEGGQEGVVQHPANRRGTLSADHMFRLQKVVKQLRVQQDAMDRVTSLLEELASSTPSSRKQSAAARESTNWAGNEGRERQPHKGEQCNPVALRVSAHVNFPWFSADGRL